MSFIRNKIRFSKVGVALGLAAIKSRRCAGRTEARQFENVALGFRSGQENLRFLASFGVVRMQLSKSSLTLPQIRHGDGKSLHLVVEAANVAGLGPDADADPGQRLAGF